MSGSKTWRDGTVHALKLPSDGFPEDRLQADVLSVLHDYKFIKEQGCFYAIKRGVKDKRKSIKFYCSCASKNRCDAFFLLRQRSNKCYWLSDFDNRHTHLPLTDFEIENKLVRVKQHETRI